MPRAATELSAAAQHGSGNEHCLCWLSFWEGFQRIGQDPRLQILRAGRVCGTALGLHGRGAVLLD